MGSPDPWPTGNGSTHESGSGRPGKIIPRKRRHLHHDGGIVGQNCTGGERWPSNPARGNPFLGCIGHGLPGSVHLPGRRVRRRPNYRAGSRRCSPPTRVRPGRGTRARRHVGNHSTPGRDPDVPASRGNRVPVELATGERRRGHEDCGRRRPPPAERPGGSGAGPVIAARYTCSMSLARVGDGHRVYRARQTPAVQAAGGAEAHQDDRHGLRAVAGPGRREGRRWPGGPHQTSHAEGTTAGPRRTASRFLVMELVKASINRLLRPSIGLPVRGAGLGAVRSPLAKRCNTPTKRGIIHRDLKPST